MCHQISEYILVRQSLTVASGFYCLYLFKVLFFYCCLQTVDKNKNIVPADGEMKEVSMQQRRKIRKQQFLCKNKRGHCVSGISNIGDGAFSFQSDH